VCGGGTGNVEIAVTERRQMTMKCKKNIVTGRFAACTAGVRLLKIDSRTARRAPVSKSSSHFHLSAGCNSRDWFKSVSQKSDKINLTRCEIFRGKVPPRITQNKKTPPRTQDAIAPNL
jgi:hypothetical protein